MYRNPSKKPMYPSHDCSNKNCTETDLVKKRCSSDLDYLGSRSDNKLLRNCNRSKTRCPKDQETLGFCSSSRQRFNDIVLVNITDRHTANGNCCGHTKIKKMGKSCKKSQKSSNGSNTNSKPVIRTKPGVKENCPNYVGKGKKGAVAKCSCKIPPNSLIGQKNVKETIKLSLTDEEDPIKNALQLTNQIKTNIDSIRAQSNKRFSIQGLPQYKFVMTGKETQDIKPNISSVTAPYIQKLRDEINANRNHSKQRQPPSISHADQEIINLRNEILQYKLKSEQDLPQAMVIEVSYLNDGEATDKNEILSKKCSLNCDEKKCSKYIECQNKCNFTLTDYSTITEKPVIDETQSIRNKLDEIEDLSSVQQSKESIDSAVNSNTNPFSQLKGIVRVSIKDKSDLTKSRKKKGGTPATEDGDSTGHAFDELDADTGDTIDEERKICCKENKSPWNSKKKVSISSLDSHENKEADLPCRSSDPM